MKNVWLIPWGGMCIAAYPLDIWRYLALICCAVGAVVLFAATRDS